MEFRYEHENEGDMTDWPVETRRLEELWSGGFGDEYVGRNRSAAEGREPFWAQLLREFPVDSVLEVGCNRGANLSWIVGKVPARNVYGIDINETALERLRKEVPGVNSLWSPAREIPFRDGWFDLVFTMGVLIHQSPNALPLVMNEIVRCSRRYVLCGEYYAEELTEVPYRGQQGALFKRDFGALYQELFPDLVLRKQGFLAKEAGGWDDVTYWLFEKSR
jgi:pseudaminic acid biosynthesis-associated methylase